MPNITNIKGKARGDSCLAPSGPRIHAALSSSLNKDHKSQWKLKANVDKQMKVN